MGVGLWAGRTVRSGGDYCRHAEFCRAGSQIWSTAEGVLGNRRLLTDFSSSRGRREPKMLARIYILHQRCISPHGNLFSRLALCQERPLSHCAIRGTTDCVCGTSCVAQVTSHKVQSPNLAG